MESNETPACTLNEYHGFHMAFLGISLSAFVIGVNLLAIITIWRTPVLHTKSNIFMVSVSLIGFFLAAGNIADMFVYYPGIRDHLPSIVLDAFSLGFYYSCLLLTICHLGVISLDRYIFIAHPFYYMTKMTKSRIFKILACAWCVCLLYGSVPMVVYTDETYQKICIITDPPTEYMFLWTAVYVSQIITICTCYFKIALLAFKRRKAASLRRTPHSESANARRINDSAAIKSARFFAIMCGIVLLFTFPLSAVGPIRRFCNVSQFVFISFVFLFMCYPAVNIFIYAYFNKDFSQAVMKQCSNVLQCCFRWKCRLNR